MEPGMVLHEAGSEIQYVYFLADGLVSLIRTVEDGESSEIVAIGNEGVVGVTAALGGTIQRNRTIVRSEGVAYRIHSKSLREEFERGDALMSRVLLYVQVLFSQVAQVAVCNRHHKLHQQFCRWLLLSIDQNGGDELAMTQQMIAGFLGVRREAVTRLALELQRQGIIDYRRGVITVRDRPRLERASCECYGVIREESERLKQ